tara:strand:- start:8482 stop:8676 length:195 start_codon:yes stop_codon:yes gene_type:complete
MEIGKKNVNFEIGEKVWVKCVGTDCWVTGEVTGLTAKRIRVWNEVRSLEGLYAPQNVMKPEVKA